MAAGSKATAGRVIFRTPRQDTVAALKSTAGSAIDWTDVIAPNATGSATAYTLNASPAIGSYETGMVVAFKAPAANTGALTLNVSSNGAKSILRADGSALLASDIAKDAVVVAVFDGTAFRVQTATVSSSAVRVQAGRLYRDHPRERGQYGRGQCGCKERLGVADHYDGG